MCPPEPPPRRPADRPHIGADATGGPRARRRGQRPARGATRSGRPQAGPYTRGEAWERPVSQTPTWRRPPPPSTTTPPRAADGLKTAGRSAEKFRFSSPGPPGVGGQPTRTSLTRPGAGGGESPTPPSPGRRARTVSTRSPARVSPGVYCYRPRAAGEFRTQ